MAKTSECEMGHYRSNGGLCRLHHVTLGGRTFYYTADAVYLNGQQVYQGIVTLQRIAALAKVI